MIDDNDDDEQTDEYIIKSISFVSLDYAKMYLGRAKSSSSVGNSNNKINGQTFFAPFASFASFLPAPKSRLMRSHERFMSIWITYQNIGSNDLCPALFHIQMHRELASLSRKCTKSVQFILLNIADVIFLFHQIYQHLSKPQYFNRLVLHSWNISTIVIRLTN